MPDHPQTTQTRPTPREQLLTVRRDGEALSADWDHGKPFALQLPLAKAELDELAWYLERYIEFPGAGDRARARALEERLADWGLALWQAIFPGGDRNAVYGQISARLDQGQPILLTLASDQPGFLIRPWEMLRDPRGPLVLRGLTLRRQFLQADTANSTPPAGLPLRVLLIVSRPEDLGFIDPRTSTRPVLDALTRLGDQVQVDFCEPPTLTELERRLAAAREAGAPYHIVHFDGHGDYSPESADGVLCFERVDGKTDLVEGRELGALLSRFQVPLVLLEACRGAQVSDRPVFGAVAPALLQSGVGSVIAFSHSVHVAAATLVSEWFYRGLAGGATVGESVQEARVALYRDRRRWLALGPDPETLELEDWIIPQLYQTGVDRALVPTGSGIVPSPSGAPATEIPLPGFPPAPRHRFHGRARELLVLERILRNHSGVLLHAGGGMGKTALAREAAHWWLRTGRFERALFHSFEQGAGAEAVVRLLGESLGGEGFVRLSPDAQWAESVRIFRQRPVLLVWDNFESVLPAFAGQDARGRPAAPVGSAVRTEAAGRTQVGTGNARADSGPHSGPYEAFDAAARADLERLYRELTEDQGPTGPAGRLLVTCRPGETGLAGIRAIRLSGLARPDALHLLRGIVERDGIDLERVGYEREEIDALLNRLEDHPLSVELVGPHLKDLTPRTLRDELAQRLDQFQDPSHAEGRNRSLLASLDFSRSRLSPAAREALPWLGWFEGGMFEHYFLAFSEIPEARWSDICAELTATALLRVEDLSGFNTPYLKLHPTLADAVAPDTGEAERAVRFVDCYLGVIIQISRATGGSQPAAGLALLGLEQPNLRRAMTQAFAAGRHLEGGLMGTTLQNYLERVGRLRERDRLAAWVLGRMPQDQLDFAACQAIREHAWTLFTQGQTQEALEAVQNLERRLEAGEGPDGDPAFELVWTLFTQGQTQEALEAVQDLQRRRGAGDGRVGPAFALATTRHYRGQILLSAGRPDLGLEPLGQAIAAFRALGDNYRGMLSATLRELGNALTALGHYDQALAATDEGLGIVRDLGDHHEVAIGLHQTAAILMDAGRYSEAEARLAEALQAAERVGDLGTQGSCLQRLGCLQRQTGRTAASIDTLRRALRSFEQSGDRGNEMRTCDLLGTAEQVLGRLDPAEAWYRKALDLAQGLGAQQQIGATRHNLGCLFHARADALPQSGIGPAAADPRRDRLLAAAVTEIEAGLAICREMGDRLGEASAHYKLAHLHRVRGDLVRAETEARQALAIWEPLGHPHALKVHLGLADIARARGDTRGTADWQAKADAKQAEVDHLAAGPDGGAGPGRPTASDGRTMDALHALTQAAHPADAAAALAQLVGLPAPLGAFARFLQAIVRGEEPLPPLPPDLPEPLAQLAAELLAALKHP